MIDRDGVAGTPADASGPGAASRVGLGRLTAREREVLAILSTGATSKAIAEELGIAHSTVKRHLTNLYGKLGAGNRVDAVREYLLSGLSNPAASHEAEHVDQ